MSFDAKHFETRLEEELKQLEEELGRVGRVNPNNPKDWEPTVSSNDVDVLEADRNEAADRIEAFEENSAILKELEIRYNNVKNALEKIKNNTYGACEVCGEIIESDRLEANPAARTCKSHMGELEGE